MFDRSHSSTQIRWWLLLGAVVIAAVLVFNVEALSPVREAVARVTMPAQRALSQLGGTLRDTFGSFGNLASLQARNEELEDTVAQLTVENLRLQEIEAENARLRGLLNFAQTQPSYEYKGSQIVGRVVSSDPGAIVQSILIDLGERNGIMLGMPVVTERGLVGRVTDVYNSASRVLLITDSNSSVDVVLQNGRLRGVLQGHAGLDPVVEYLPPDKPVLVGDIVLTSGEGGSFPKGIPVGQVVEVEHNDVQMFQQATVLTTVDFNTLETVLVVVNFVPVVDLENLPER